MIGSIIGIIGIYWFSWIFVDFKRFSIFLHIQSHKIHVKSYKIQKKCPVCVMHCRRRFFFWKNDVPGIFMPCVCVMHCRRRFFFGKNDVPGICMPCVCVMHCRRRFLFGKNDVPGICMPCVWTSYIMWGDPGQRTANFVKTIGKATGSEGRTSLKAWENSFQANKTKSNFQ